MTRNKRVGHIGQVTYEVPGDNEVVNPILEHRRLVKECRERRLVKQLHTRCQGKCEQCGKPPDFRGIEVHHKVHRSQGGSDTLDNLIALCGPCHSASHGVVEKQADPMW